MRLCNNALETGEMHVSISSDTEFLFPPDHIDLQLLAPRLEGVAQTLGILSVEEVGSALRRAYDAIGAES